MATAQTIIIADDHPLFRAALQQALQQSLGNLDYVEAEDFAAVYEAAAEYPEADLLLLDLKMPGAQGLSGLAYLRSQYPALPVVVVSAQDDPELIHQALDQGVSGFIPKSTPLPVLVEALEAVLAGEIWVPLDLPARSGPPAAEVQQFARRLAELTPQQFRVLGLISEGLLNKQIADRLEVSEATVKAHVTAILRKLQVHSRTQAALASQYLQVDDEVVG